MLQMESTSCAQRLKIARVRVIRAGAGTLQQLLALGMLRASPTVSKRQNNALLTIDKMRGRPCPLIAGHYRLNFVPSSYWGGWCVSPYPRKAALHDAAAGYTARGYRSGYTPAGRLWPCQKTDRIRLVPPWLVPRLAHKPRPAHCPTARVQSDLGRGHGAAPLRKFRSGLLPAHRGLLRRKGSNDARSGEPLHRLLKAKHTVIAIQLGQHLADVGLRVAMFLAVRAAISRLVIVGWAGSLIRFALTCGFSQCTLPSRCYAGTKEQEERTCQAQPVELSCWAYWPLVSAEP